MKISIVGTGYVGLTAGVGLATKAHEIITVDKDKTKIDMINDGEPPIHEENMDKLLKEVVKDGRLRGTVDTEEAVRNTDVTFISVGTPTKEDGGIDLSYVEQASKDIGKALREKDEYHVVSCRSTVVPTTTEEVVIPALEEESGKKAGEDFGVCMTPEFLREGAALDDFLNPDRIVIGELDERSGDVIEGVYSDFDAPIVRTGLRAAEMVKYGSNSFLATKISFINELGNICKDLGIDVYEVAEAIGMDHRIDEDFLRAGAGFGGSCFPKDVRAIIEHAKDLGSDPELLESVIDVNEDQKTRLVDMLEDRMDLGGKKVAVLGLAFKPGTDDIRKSPAIPIIRELKDSGASVVGYDPEAMGNMREVYPDIEYAGSARGALSGVDACLVVTAWDEFFDLSSDDLPEVTFEGRRMGLGEGIAW